MALVSPAMLNARSASAPIPTNVLAATLTLPSLICSARSVWTSVPLTLSCWAGSASLVHLPAQNASTVLTAQTAKQGICFHSQTIVWEGVRWELMNRQASASAALLRA